MRFKFLFQRKDFIKNSIRGSDRLYRYGGEEFLLLLPETGEPDARILCQRLVAGLHGLSLPHCQSPHNVVTVSAGIASTTSARVNDSGWQNIVELADSSLYRAKSCGRNQVT